MLCNALAKTPRGVVTIVFETTDSIQHMFFRYLDKAHPALKAAPGPDERRGHRGPLQEDGRPGRPGRGRARQEGRPVRHVGPRLQVLPPGRQPQLLAPPERLPGPRGRAGPRAASGSRTSIGRGRRPTPSASAAFTSTSRAGRPRASSSRAPKRRLSRPSSAASSARSRTAGTARPRSPTSTTARPSTPGPYKDNAPDLIIGYNEGYRASWDGVTGIVNAVVIEDNTKAWSGDHCIDPALVPGVLFSNLKIKRPDPSIMDVAPTVLELFGIAPPAHMDGRGLVDVGRTLRPRTREGVMSDKKRAALSRRDFLKAGVAASAAVGLGGAAPLHPQGLRPGPGHERR